MVLKVKLKNVTIVHVVLWSRGHVGNDHGDMDRDDEAIGLRLDCGEAEEIGQS